MATAAAVRSACWRQMTSTTDPPLERTQGPVRVPGFAPEPSGGNCDGSGSCTEARKLPMLVRDYFEGSGMSLQEYFKFPEMKHIRNPIHEYFRLERDGNNGGSGWIEEGMLQVEEAEDGWVLLGAEHQELARIAVGRSGNRHYYAYAWDGSYISPILRTTSFALRLSANVVGHSAAMASSAMRYAISTVRSASPPVVPPRDAALEDRFVEESVVVGGQTWYFRVWLPIDMESKRQENDGSLPVFLMLHGFKECGWDNWWQTNAGLPSCLLHNHKWATWFPGIIVLPQLPRKPWDERWWEHWRAPGMQEMALACLEHSVSKYNADRRRIYLLGESLGTEGAWYMAAAKPSIFAGVGGSCGSVEPYDWIDWDWASAPDSYRTLAERISRDLPIWFCHGAKDDFVPIQQSRQFHEALTRSRQSSAVSSLLCRTPGADVVFREYEDMDHHVWDHAYSEDDMLEWLLSHRKR